jgi:hypothetical protein
MPATMTPLPAIDRDHAKGRAVEDLEVGRFEAQGVLGSTSRTEAS